MPVPVAAAIGAIVGIIGRILLRAAPKAGKEAAKQAAKEGAKQEAKRELKEEIKQELKDEVTQAVIDEAFEAVREVVGAAGDDMKQEANRKATELRLIATGSPNPTAPRQPEYKPYYQRKIPFRPVICRILCFADKNPILSKVRAKLPDGPPSPDVEIKESVRQLRQLTAAICFDLLDKAFDYQSFIKSEVSYKRDGTAYCEGTKPKRIGITYWRKPRGSISPDIAIVEVRQQPPHRDNLFAVVDVKFQNDRAKREQMENYDNTFTRNKVSIVRFPEDCPKCDALDNKKPGNANSDDGSSRRRRIK